MEETLERQKTKEVTGRDAPEREREEWQSAEAEREEPQDEAEREEPEDGATDRDEPEDEAERGSDEPQGGATDRDEPEDEDERDEPKRAEREREEAQSGPSMIKLIGGLLAFMALALYFVWIGNEMGSHAASGSFEMWAIFGAIFIGVVALIAGGASTRRNSGG